jgi:anaerobic ribonucleoside-triphosphate reductase activating protein
LNIAGTDYDINLKALWIYFSGCNPPHCRNCHNSCLWDFSVGSDYKIELDKIINNLNTSITKWAFIAGGEPLDQNNHELEDFLKTIKTNCKNIDIWLWTRFQEEDIPENIKQYLSYAKVGEYICDSESYEEPLFGITLASTNQRIIRINQK